MRTRIEERIASGEFTLEEVAAILALPGAPSGAETESPARGHLYRRGQDLLRSVGCEEASWWPGAGLATHPSVCPCQKER